MLDYLVLVILITVLLIFILILLLVTGVVFLFLKDNFSQYIPQIPFLQGSTQGSKEVYTPDFVKPGVPLEDFTPNPKKKIKVKYEEDDQGLHGLSLEEDE